MENLVIDENKVLDDEKKKKIVALAFQGENFSSKFLLCWTNTLSYLWQSGNYEFLIACGDNQSSFHSRLRTLGLNNEIHKPFNNTKYDYWITIDHNMLFTPQQIIDMIDSLDKYDVVSGLYKTEDAINYNVIQKLDTDFFAKNGGFKYLNQEELDKWKENSDNKYMEVEYVGLSFFGAKSEVFEKLDYPYFNGNNLVINKEDGSKYDIVPSEEYNLCKNIINAGYKIMLNTELRLGCAVKLVV